MQICVRTSEGLTLDFELRETETIETLKSKIYEKEGILTPFQKLMYNDRVLEDDHTIGSYQIKDNTCVSLFEEEDDVFDLFLFLASFLPE